VAIGRGTLQGDPLSPLLFDLMIEPLIRWLNAAGKGYQLTSCGLKLTSKWYADDGTLVTNLVDDMISLLAIIQEFSEWSGIHFNVGKCKVTAYIYELQSIPPQKGPGRSSSRTPRAHHSRRTAHKLPNPGRISPGRILRHVPHGVPLSCGTPTMDKGPTQSPWEST